MIQAPHSICFVAPFAYPVLAARQDIDFVGGAEVQQVIVARGLAARGHRVSMICLDYGQADQVCIDGVKVFRACGPDQGIPVLRFVWPRITSIIDCMRRADAEIYYQRTASMLTGLVALFCLLAHRRSIFAAAGNPDLFRPSPRVPNIRDRWIFEYGLRHVDQILVQNREQAALCEANWARPCRLVPNCHPVRPRSQNQRGDVVLWVSTIRRVKRPGLFLDLAAALPHRKFRMVGGPAPDDSALFASIKSRAAGLANVDFVGFVPYPEIDKQFDDVALFVNTSESEGFPNTFLQAWSRSIPTVSFVDCGAYNNGIQIGKQVHSTEQLLATTEALLSDDMARSDLGALSHRYFLENHSTEHTLDLYEQVLADVLFFADQDSAGHAQRRSASSISRNHGS